MTRASWRLINYGLGDEKLGMALKNIARAHIPPIGGHFGTLLRNKPFNAF